MEIILTASSIFRTKEFYFLLYIFFINLYGFGITAMDKTYARKNRWRIQEKNFFITALLGGSAGILLAMTMFRHKTQHKSFYIGIPIAYMVNVIYLFLVIWLMYLP